ncbi:glutamyl-Q tRNA(Asp) synthetase [Methylobacillus rhizosphaerae]|uniref:Glutamyl-Q tRNA(Asp) synthetase n=1 Tax=Methylobacillus rhizosphaerae TaxID=551994 RepID=A0A238YV74_9PROT|nr:tRNA glutamyl-Q(34) synthetase GluQRS [Methylobacillus rhizosphaerae]SNR74631.1 glutamyl-Q tRNA(Asp) synthetase [Methylobacillus rhizosphaerae]
MAHSAPDVARGRFAPSPTGPLHFGSLIAATASYLDARSLHGEWLVRMEDLDLPRQMPGAADLILTTLEQYGFEWDGPVLYQSQRDAYYQHALQTLTERGLTYPCGCSRKEIADSAATGIDGLVYPGTCRHGLAGKHARAWRVQVNHQPTQFQDRVQGEISQLLSRDIGDFVLKRADGLFAYQLAVVVDDELQGISHIVRGADLLDSTPRQIFLQQALGYATPAYLHVPVAANAAGEKLSKQTLAKPLNSRYKVADLWRVLTFLGQSPPDELYHQSLSEVWQWALQHWQPARIPRQRAIPIQVRHAE